MARGEHAPEATNEAAHSELARDRARVNHEVASGDDAVHVLEEVQTTIHSGGVIQPRERTSERRPGSLERRTAAGDECSKTERTQLSESVSSSDR